MKKFFTDFLIYGILFAILGYAIGVGLAFLINNLTWESALLSDSIAFICLAIGVISGFIMAVTLKAKKSDTNKRKGKSASGEEMELHFDAGFVTRDKILADKLLINSTWSSLPSLKNTGMVFRNEYFGSRYEVTMKDETHALIIGTTGTGKTTMILEPTIRILAHTAEKPSLVIADPKGELFDHHAKALMNEGYDVRVYDLDNPYISSRWNPMEKPFKMYHQALNIYKEAKKYQNCTPEQAGKARMEGREYGDVWYEFDGVAFPNEEELNKQLNSRKQELLTAVSAEIKGIAASLCPVSQGTNDTIWEQGAQDFLNALMLAMLEDSTDQRLGENKLRMDQYNFYNLYKIANKKDPTNADDAFGPLKRYCMGRPQTSNVSALALSVINAAPSTTKSYMSVLSGKINNLMSDMGICYATSGCDIQFTEFVDRPTAFFIKIPDHKKERHSLATICISQLYRTLVDVANNYPNRKLPRHVYFILDEFGNLPVIQDFGTMITVSRSRNIIFEIVIQSFTQLDTKYGKEIAETLKSNFNIQIFLGTEDPATREAFSKSCGEIQLTTQEESTTENKGKTETSKSVSTSQQRVTRPLVDPYELSVLPYGTGIVKLFRYNPIKVKPAPWYKTSQMTKYDPLVVSKIGNSLDENKVFYDIDKRNNIVLGRSAW